jgi:hypothetical protein
MILCLRSYSSTSRSRSIFLVLRPCNKSYACPLGLDFRATCHRSSIFTITTTTTSLSGHTASSLLLRQQQEPPRSFWIMGSSHVPHADIHPAATHSSSSALSAAPACLYSMYIDLPLASIWIRSSPCARRMRSTLTRAEPHLHIPPRIHPRTSFDVAESVFVATLLCLGFVSISLPLC